MPKIIVYVSGGVVQDIISDTEGVEVMIVNYDDEECDKHKTREFHRAEHNLDYFNRTVEGLEDTRPC